jgi:hypothetical protein
MELSGTYHGIRGVEKHSGKPEHGTFMELWNVG